MIKTKIISALLVTCGLVSGQATQNQTENAARMAAGEPPIFRASVTARTAKAINYRHRSGATKIDFRGTDLLPNSRGEAKVESKQGYIEIEVEFDNLQPATRNGTEYLTYVLWAITPEGRTSNLGEILLNGTKSKLDVTTQLQVFALVVTAEPYYAVSRPSDLIVMENVVRNDTIGKIEEMDAKYELLQRGQYQRLSNPLSLKADKKLPLELYEARNAVQIARAIGADRFAAETFQKAEKSLSAAEAYQARNAGRKSVTMTAREAVQTAEDARAIAVKRQEEEMLAAERLRSIDRETRAESARVAAQSETDRVKQEAELVRIKADRMKLESDATLMAARAEADRLRVENDSRIAEANRLKMENDAQKAVSQVELDSAVKQAANAKAEADKFKQENEVRTAAAAIEADRIKVENEARALAAKAEADRLKQGNDASTLAAKAEADRLKQLNEASASTAKAEADVLRQTNEKNTLAAKAEAERLKIANDANTVAARTESDRLRIQNDAKMAAAASEADRLKQENDAQRASSQAELANAAKQKTQLETEKVELRILLLKQFNAVLQTQDTARGLIVNMSDVLFDTGKYSLRPLAREKLAKIAGIVSGHPGLKLDVEGHTDSVGGDDYNQKLSENRGMAVRNYLTKEGMAEGSVTSKGFGESQPTASNDTADGRQKNRRVEIVITGDVIGTAIGIPIASK